LGRRVNRMTRYSNEWQQRIEKWDLHAIPTATPGHQGPRTDTTAPGKKPETVASCSRHGRG
jgi:hypothetical protein